MNEHITKIKIGNRTIQTRKKRFSKHELLRIQTGERITQTHFHDAKPDWIVKLYAEFGIKYYKRENPVDRMQSELQRKHKAIEKACRKFAEAKQAEQRQQRKQRRNRGERNGNSKS